MKGFKRLVSALLALVMPLGLLSMSGCGAGTGQLKKEAFGAYYRYIEENHTAIAEAENAPGGGPGVCLKDLDGDGVPELIVLLRDEYADSYGVWPCRKCSIMGYRDGELISLMDDIILPDAGGGIEFCILSTEKRGRLGVIICGGESFSVNPRYYTLELKEGQLEEKERFGAVIYDGDAPGGCESSFSYKDGGISITRYLELREEFFSRSKNILIVNGGYKPSLPGSAVNALLEREIEGMYSEEALSILGADMENEIIMVPAEPEAPLYSPDDQDIVRVKDFIPDIFVDLKYAGSDNFTGAPVYDFSEAFLRYGTVKKLAGAQRLLREQGLSLIIWDAYRPNESQQALWEIKPDPIYVANPYAGRSRHSGGGAVDVGIVTAEGESVELPSGYDEFSALGDRDYSDVSPLAGENAGLLEDIMRSCGFDTYSAQWWLYYDSDIESFGYDDIAPQTVYAGSRVKIINCSSSVSLRASADGSSEVYCELPAGAEVILLGGSFGGYTRAEYEGMKGFVLTEYLERPGGTAPAPAAAPAPASAPAPAPTSAPAANDVPGERESFYAVFIGAFPDEATAQGLLRGARAQGFKAELIFTDDWESFAPGWVSVAAGRFKSADEAERVKNSAVSMGYSDAYVLWSGKYTGGGDVIVEIEHGNPPLSVEPDWKERLAAYLESLPGPEEYAECLLLNVDSDGVPELFMYGDSMAAGCTLVTLKGSGYYTVPIDRMDMEYHEGGGVLRNPSGVTGGGGDKVYVLEESGPACVFSGSYLYEVREDGSTRIWDCEIEGRAVSDGEYKTELKRQFDYEDSRTISVSRDIFLPFGRQELIDLLRSDSMSPAMELRCLLAGYGKYTGPDGSECGIEELKRTYPRAWGGASFYGFSDLDGDGQQELIMKLGDYDGLYPGYRVFSHKDGHMRAEDISALPGPEPQWYDLGGSAFGGESPMQEHQGFPEE